MKSEPFEPRDDSLELIEKCIQDISTDVAQLHDWFANYAQAQKKRIAFDCDLVEEYCDPETVIVEAASIPLLLTIPLKLKGFHIIGVDIQPERFQTTIQQFELDVRKCNIEQEALPFPENFCDAVVFNEIFEHLRINLIFTMRELFRILKPGGRLFLSTRNVRSLMGIRNFLFHKICQSGSTDIFREYSKLEDLGHMGHVREYTSTEVSRFLIKIGFQVEEVIYRETYDSYPNRVVTRFFPNLRPAFSCIARKPS